MNIEQILKKITELKRANTNYVSNGCFNVAQWKRLNEKGLISATVYDKSVWVTIRDKDIYRLLFFADSTESLTQVNARQYRDYDMPVILEFLCEQDTNEKVQNILIEMGFCRLRDLEYLFCTSVHIEEKYQLQAGYSISIAVAKDCMTLYNMLYDIFDIRISRLPSEEQIISDIDSQRVFILKHEQEIVGIAYFQRQGAKAEYLYQFALQSKERGKGLSYALLAYAMNCLGIEKKYSAWVEKDNVKAMHLYEKFGFENVGLKEFIYQNARTLPVVLLLDTSGSMYENGKIATMNSAVNEMIEGFKSLDSTNAQISVSIITFGGVAQKFQDLKPANEVEAINMTANGNTPLGSALNIAKSMIEDKEVITSRAYRPVVVLVSDGMPNDNWEQPLEQFKSDGRTSKCYRMAMGIGVSEGSAEYQMLQKFIDKEERVFCASDARGIEKFFKYVTMSVATRTKSQNPNIIAKPADIIVDDEDDDAPLF